MLWNIWKWRIWNHGANTQEKTEKKKKENICLKQIKDHITSKQNGWSNNMKFSNYTKAELLTALTVLIQSYCQSFDFEILKMINVNLGQFPKSQWFLKQGHFIQINCAGVKDYSDNFKVTRIQCSIIISD